jgi:hypothetical protein
MPAGLINRSARRSHELKSAKVHYNERTGNLRELELDTLLTQPGPTAPVVGVVDSAVDLGS